MREAYSKVLKFEIKDILMDNITIPATDAGLYIITSTEEYEDHNSLIKNITI